MSESFGGSVIVVSNSTPSNPRSWDDVEAWATGERAMLGGSPAASVTFQNRMVYPKTGYTVGTTYPPIQVYDGVFDHELARLPPTDASVVPQAVLSMLAANGTIYLSTFDTGTSPATWAGRVFSLDLASGVLEPLGDPFTGGELPYALGWHMNRLWVGTNRGDGTGGGVYFFRPGIDEAWSIDHRLVEHSLGGVVSLRSYQGQLYVGTDGAAGTLGAVLVRSALGVYTVADTGGGVSGAADLVTLIANMVVSPTLFAAYDTAGVLRDPWDRWYLPSFDTYTALNGVISPPLSAAYATADIDAPLETGGTVSLSAIAQNGYLAMAVFDDVLYASYWNHGATATSVIREYNGTTWSTSYTAASSTLRPFIVLFEDADLLFAVGGGMGLTGALVSTLDGNTWTDKTAYLPETDKTLLPIYGVEVL